MSRLSFQLTAISLLSVKAYIFTSSTFFILSSCQVVLYVVRSMISNLWLYSTDTITSVGVIMTISLMWYALVLKSTLPFLSTWTILSLILYEPVSQRNTKVSFQVQQTILTFQRGYSNTTLVVRCSNILILYTFDHEYYNLCIRSLSNLIIYVMIIILFFPFRKQYHDL